MKNRPNKKIPIILSVLVAAVFVVTTLITSAAPTKPTAAPGMISDITWGVDRPTIDRTLDLLESSGVKWLRADVNWKTNEPSPGVYTFYDMDYAIQSARSRGMNVLVGASLTPVWARVDPSQEYSKPKNMQDFANFMKVVVNRYKPYGVKHYQVWNEPNHPRFWPTGVNAAEYVEMLKPSYNAIKQADPSAQVVFAGISMNDYVFLEQAYAAGAKGYFDIMSTHPYTTGGPPEYIGYNSDGRMLKESFPAYREVRRSMLAQGDEKPLWFTEFGWATTSNHPWGVSEAQQSDYLTRAFEYIKQDPYVKVAFWYNFRNNYWANDANTWEDQLGLLRTDFSSKPSHDAYKRYSRGFKNTKPFPSYR